MVSCPIVFMMLWTSLLFFIHQNQASGQCRRQMCWQVRLDHTNLQGHHDTNSQGHHDTNSQGHHDTNSQGHHDTNSQGHHVLAMHSAVKAFCSLAPSWSQTILRQLFKDRLSVTWTFVFWKSGVLLFLHCQDAVSYDNLVLRTLFHQVLKKCATLVKVH